MINHKMEDRGSASNCVPPSATSGTTIQSGRPGARQSASFEVTVRSDPRAGALSVPTASFSTDNWLPAFSRPTGSTSAPDNRRLGGSTVHLASDMGQSMISICRAARRRSLFRDCPVRTGSCICLRLGRLQSTSPSDTGQTMLSICRAARRRTSLGDWPFCKDSCNCLRICRLHSTSSSVEPIRSGLLESPSAGFLVPGR